VGCDCNKTRKFRVIYPDGRTALKNSRAAAELAAAKIPGSKIEAAK